MWLQSSDHLQDSLTDCGQGSGVRGHLTLEVFRCGADAVMTIGLLRGQALLRLHRQGVHQILHTIANAQLDNHHHNSVTQV